MLNNTKNALVLDIETTSFEAWTGRLIAIGTKDLNNNEIRVFQDEHEESMLIQFFKYLNKNKYSEIIGYNVAYDLRFIFVKCIQYKIPANGFFSIKKTDIMMILKNINGGYNFNKPGTLDDWAKALLGKKKLFNNIKILNKM